MLNLRKRGHDTGEDPDQIIDYTSDQDPLCSSIRSTHYENMPIQIYWKFYNLKRKIFR